MENPFERLVRSVVDYAIYLLDPDGRITSWNAGAERIKGYREADVLGRHLSIFYTEEDRRLGRAERNLAEAREHGRFSADDWRVRRDGSRFWASVVIDALYDDEGRLIGFAKITRDRTDEHRAQEARVQAERDQWVASLAGDHTLMLLDAQGTIVQRRDRETVDGGSPHGPVAAGDAGRIGEPYAACLPADERDDALVQAMLAQARTDGRHRGEGWRLREDGTRFWGAVVIDRLDDPRDGSIGYAVVTRDATARREAEAQWQASRAQLRQAHKLEAIGQLTGGIAHDFNNLLTGILGSLQLVRRRAQAGQIGELDRFIGAAETSAQRAAALTHRLLAFARRQSLSVAAVDVNRLVNELSELFDRTLGKQMHVELRLSDDAGAALTDRNELETALLNLVINARDAMREGGVVRVESARLRARDPALPAEIAASDHDFIRISVVDSGAGMSPSVLEQATEAFFTTKPPGQGTGLGLSMIHGFMRQSGGLVRLESELGVGTRAHLFLPAASDEATAGEDAAVATPTGRGEVVLVVEDEPGVRMLVTEVLTELNYRYLEADRSQTALAILQSSSTRIDLLISDLALPGIDGRRLAELGRQARPDLKVLFITGDERVGHGRQAPLPTGMALLRKPFALTELGVRIRSLLGPPH